MQGSSQPYLFDSKRGVKGQIADGSLRIVDSFAAEEEIEFGQAVERGTNEEKQVVGFDGGDFLGVAVFSQTQVEGKYPETSEVSVMTKGRVVVDALLVDVDAGDTAYVVDATGVYTNLAASATEVGTFLTSGTGLQVLELK